MSTNAVIEQYRQAIADAKSLNSRVYAAYCALPSTLDKFRFVLELGTEFLDTDPYYCPHLTSPTHGDITLYDDFYWERYQTCNVEDFFDRLYTDQTGQHLRGEPLKAALREDPERYLNQDSPAAYVVRDMLDSALKSGTHDW